MIIFFTFEELLILLFCIFAPCIFFGYKAYELIDFFADHWLAICIGLLIMVVIVSFIVYKATDLTLGEIIKHDILVTPLLLFPPVSIIPAIINSFHEHGILWGIFNSFIEVLVFLLFFGVMIVAVGIAEVSFWGFFGGDGDDDRKDITKTIEFIFAVAIEIGAYVLYFV